MTAAKADKASLLQHAPLETCMHTQKPSGAVVPFEAPALARWLVDDSYTSQQVQVFRASASINTQAASPPQVPAGQWREDQPSVDHVERLHIMRVVGHQLVGC
jgi:ABC-type taurine transport system substrate-binding protein